MTDCHESERRREQIPLFEDWTFPVPPYTAIYFCMGMYNKDDVGNGGVTPQMVGLDCPFDDSLVLQGRTLAKLEQEIAKTYAGSRGMDFEHTHPDVICDSNGRIMAEAHKLICRCPKFNPDTQLYSSGRESLADLWERERWRWFSDPAD